MTSYKSLKFIYKKMSWVQVTLGVTLCNITLLNIFLIGCKFDKSTVGLHYLCIFSIFTKFQGDEDQ